MKLKLYLSVILLLLSSCKTTPIKKVDNTVPEHILSTVVEKSKTITDLSDKGIKSKDPQYYAPIKVHSVDITGLSTDAGVKLDELQKYNEELKKDLDKSKSELQKSLHKIWIGLIGLGALGMVTGIFLLLLKQVEIGGIVLVGSGAVTGVSYFILSYWWILAIICGLALLSILVYTGYNLYYKSKEIKKKETIVKELVQTADALKNAPYDDSKKLELLKLQSPETIAEVRAIKENLDKTL